MKKINSYEVLERVGRGGMGTVYKVRHTLRNEILALKQLNDDSPEIQKRFENEAVVLSKLSHPNIVQVNDFFSFENELYIAMEFVDGKPLSQIIGKEVGPIISEKAVPLFIQILQGMSHAHQNGIVHRDIKPANILVGSDGTIKITDFGIAKVLGATMGTAGMKMGTIYYMSPEQMEGEEIDERSDIYSLGMTFYEMLAGRLPFNFANTSNPFAIMKQVHDAEIPDPREYYPHIPESVVIALMKSIQKDKRRRYQRIDEFLRALDGKVEVVAPEKIYTPKISIPESVAKSGIGNEMVFVEGGTFLMGSEDGDLDEMPTHWVTINSFWIAKYPVTQELWIDIMGINPSYFKGKKRPVETISWYDAIEFCNRLSEKEGLTPCYSEETRIKKTFFGRLAGLEEDVINCNFYTDGYRLLTEAEWEFVARGGNKTGGFEYSGHNEIEKVAWYCANANGSTHDVGKKKPNELGIFDMSGNIHEWCWDLYSQRYYSVSEQSNPVGPLSGYYRVSRGGDWGSDESSCSVVKRHYFNPADGFGTLGFRLARTM